MPYRKGTPEYEAWKNSPKYAAMTAKMSADRQGRILSEEHKALLRTVERSNGWTEQEESILREKWATHTASQIALLLSSRSAEAVNSRANDLGLKKREPLEPIEEDGLPAYLFLPSDGQKECSSCGKIKSLSQFRVRGETTSGYDYRCRACHNQYPRNRKEKNKITTQEVSEILPDGHKRCIVCLEVKLFEAFTRSSQRKDGRESRCKKCSKTSAEQNRRQALSSLYGLTLEEYAEMLKSQGGVCACCGKPETLERNGTVRPLMVDHCHVTDAIRGLLCHRCNVSLGLMGEDPNRIKSLLRYVEDRCLW